jgi:hypothetical protein
LSSEEVEEGRFAEQQKLMDKSTFSKSDVVNGDETAEDAEQVCRQGNGEVRAYSSGQRYIESEETTEARVEI